MLFDIRTLAIVGFCGELAFLIFLFLLPRRFNLNNVLVELRWAVVFTVTGMAGHAVRGFAPPVLTVYLANFCLLVALFCFGRGIRRLRGWPASSRLDFLVAALFLLLFIPHNAELRIMPNGSYMLNTIPLQAA